MLDLVAVRTLDPDLLREAGRAQQADVRRHQDHDDREGEEQALDQLDLHRAVGSGAAEGGDEVVDEEVEGDAARRLDEDDVAGREVPAEDVQGLRAVGDRR